MSSIETELRTEIQQAFHAALRKAISQGEGMVDVDAALDAMVRIISQGGDAIIESQQVTYATLMGVYSEGVRQSLEFARTPIPAKVTMLRRDPRPIEPLVRVVARAVEVLGTSEKALRWIDTPVRSLGDRTPLSLLDSPEGMVSVEDALGRIEHGVW